MSYEELQTIHKRLDAQDKTLMEIHSALVGNPSMGHKGLVTQVAENTKAIQEQHSKLIRWGGMVAGASVALSMVKDKFLGGGS